MRELKNATASGRFVVFCFRSKLLHITGLQLELGKPYSVDWSSQESLVEDNEKFNCYPDSGASEENCTARGCIWQVSRNDLCEARIRTLL